MSFDDFSDQVEAHMSLHNGWTEIQVADFISPRTLELIRAYQNGDAVESTAATLLTKEPAQQYWD